jgi:glycosyltransferase involved in cell wall biosynthesis
VLKSLDRHLPDMDVVVVDDGSTDATAEMARAGGAVVLRLPFNLGIGGALRCGFRYAVSEGYQRAVQLDADGQHDPALVPVLLEHLDGADMVVGSRFRADGGDVYEVGRTRRGAMRVLGYTLRLLSGQTFTDTSSGFRAFNRDVLEFFADSYPSEYMESVEALLAASHQGFRIVEVPVEMHQRAGGQPSTQRLRLVYHYVRLLVPLLSQGSRRRPAPDPAPERSTPDPANPAGADRRTIP